jgi:hypothetical protein
LFEKLKQKIGNALKFLLSLYSKDIKNEPAIPKGTKRAYFIAWVVETSIGTLMFIVLFGTVAMPQFLATSTTGWTLYSVTLWVLIPLICIGGFVTRVIRSAQSGFIGPITGY